MLRELIPLRVPGVRASHGINPLLPTWSVVGREFVQLRVLRIKFHTRKVDELAQPSHAAAENAVFVHELRVTGAEDGDGGLREHGVTG